MTDQYQCDNCGAVLTEDDVFCGECGAPQPAARAAQEAAGPETAAAPAPGPRPRVQAPRPAKPGSGPERWRTAAIVAATLGVAAAVALCALGLFVAFLVPDADTGLTASQDMLLASGLCCFCPGALALILAIVVWALVIRRK
ncbi:zinc ribbon domain-containing protein [Chloroflexota bacterium]